MTSGDLGQALGLTLGALAELPREVAALRAEVSALRGQVAELVRAQPPALVTPEVAAERLEVSLSTIRRRIKDGSLPCRRVGRAVRVDLGAMHAPTDVEVVRLARAARKAG